jgi:hypothetical protein
MIMIHFIVKVLEKLQAYIPLMQSLVWPIVVLIAIFIFRSHVRACIDAIRKRIEAGGGLKAGPLELPPMIPATPHEQAKKLENEVAEEVTSPTTVKASDVERTPSQSGQRDFMASYVLAEDLVMKKLSAELNLKIVRQVKAKLGVNYIFDGVALEEDKFIAIEVKLLRSTAHAKITARQTLDRLNTYYTSLSDNAKRQFSLILAFVIHDDNQEDTLRQLNFIREIYQFPIHVVCYRFLELQAEFGIK